MRGSAGLISRNGAVRAAVEDIARIASLRANVASQFPAAAVALKAAVAVLLAERPARESRAHLRSNKTKLADFEVLAATPPLVTNLAPALL